MQRRAVFLSSLGAALLSACGGEDAATKNRYRQTLLLANKTSHKARFTEPEFVNGWGVAIAPVNFGGTTRIRAFDGTTGSYLDDLRDPDDKAVGIAYLWAAIGQRRKPGQCQCPVLCRRPRG